MNFFEILEKAAAGFNDNVNDKTDKNGSCPKNDENTDKVDNDIKKLYEVFKTIVNVEDNNTKKSNANIDGNTPAGQMMIFGAESSKNFSFDNLIDPRFVEAHKLGYIHIHDADYYATKAWNCNHMDLVELFKKQYSYTNDSTMRNPKRVYPFTALSAIAMQSEQNENFGGQSIQSWDYAMAKGVRMSFLENFKKYCLTLKEAGALENNIRFPEEEIRIGNEELKEYYPVVYKLAYQETLNDTHEAVVAFIYNLCSMHSRGGGQVVFSSINYGTDDSPEGRMIIDQTLDAVEEGLGDASTAIFPISIFRVKDGINFSEEDWELAKNNWEDAVAGKLKFKTPNFDMFIKSCVVSAHRLFPNYLFLDSTFNYNPLWKAEDPNRYRYELATMGCRTRVYDDIFGEKTCVRRGNLSFTTINLPRLAIEARLHVSEIFKEFTADDVIADFYSKLDAMMELVKEQLIERYKWQCSAYAKQFPFIVKNNTVMGTEELDPDDHMEKALKHGTLSIGFIGLAETLKELIGKHHGESEEAQKLGLEIIGHMRKMTDRMTNEENLNFSLFATPAEGLSGRFTKIDREEFGVIPGVTDREYYTNSNHVPVYYPISACKKILTEAPYHALTNAGHICYVEMDGDPRKNTLAFATLVVAMKKANIGYGSINHAVDRCDICGYEGIIKNACPKCGNDNEENIDRIRRITGYLVGSVNKRWNSYKKAEEHDRVKHI